METSILFVWGFEAEVEEAQLPALVCNNGEESIVSLSIDSPGRATVVFINPEAALAAFLCNVNQLHMSLESFPEVEPAEVTEMTQGLTSQVNSLGQESSVVINPEHNQDSMALSLRNPRYMPLYTFPNWEWDGSTSQVNSSQEWTIPMTQVHDPPGSSMYRNPHAQETVPLINPLGSSMNRNSHAQEPMMHHGPLLNPFASYMYRNPHAQETVPLVNPLGSSMHRNPHAQETFPLINPLGSSMNRNSHAQEPMMHHGPLLNPFASYMYRNPYAQETVPLVNPLGSSMHRNPHAQEPVRHHVPHLQWREQIRDGMAKKLIVYVSNFAFELEEAGLKSLFLPFGEVTSCRIRRCKVTGRSKGDGYVHFSTTEGAQRAATELNGQFVDDRQIWVSFARVKSEV